MTQLRAWKCDICGKEFIERSDDSISLNYGDFKFEFGTVSMFIPSVKKDYDTICLDCRKNMLESINDGLIKCGCNVFFC